MTPDSTVKLQNIPFPWRLRPAFSHTLRGWLSCPPASSSYLLDLAHNHLPQCPRGVQSPGEQLRQHRAWTLPPVTFSRAIRFDGSSTPSHSSEPSLYQMALPQDTSLVCPLKRHSLVPDTPSFPAPSSLQFLSPPQAPCFHYCQIHLGSMGAPSKHSYHSIPNSLTQVSSFEFFMLRYSPYRRVVKVTGIPTDPSPSFPDGQHLT